MATKPFPNRVNPYREEFAPSGSSYYLLHLPRIEKGEQNETGRNASLESRPIHLKIILFSYIWEILHNIVSLLYLNIFLFTSIFMESPKEIYCSFSLFVACNILESVI